MSYDVHKVEFSIHSNRSDCIGQWIINNAVRLKNGLDRFWCPTNQNFDFKPFIFLLENNKD